MAPPIDLLVATRNPGKVSEIRTGLINPGLNLITLDQFPDISPVEESGSTYEENAMLKALSYSQQSGLLALADDSGLEVDALGGLPGLFSARFGGPQATDRERIERLLAALSNTGTEKRTARFVCCMTLAYADAANRTRKPALLKVTRGECEGLLTEQPRGTSGFGYDPIFIPAGYESTLAELPLAVKNTVSHRAKALAAMRSFLEPWAIGELDRRSGGS